MYAARGRLIATAWALFAASICGAQAGRPSGGSVGQAVRQAKTGQMTKAQALKACQDFLKKIGTPAAPGAIRVRFSQDWAAIHEFELKSARLRVEANIGGIKWFENNPRRYLPRGAPVPIASDRFKDDARAKSYLRGLAKRLGYSEEYKLAEFESHLTIDPHTDGSGTLPHIRARYEKMPFGYRMRVALDGFGIGIDPSDGAVVSYARIVWPFIVESHEAKLDFKQARALALPIVQKHTLGKWRSTDGLYRGTTPPPAKPSFLGYVVPNKTFGSPDYREGRPYRLRLAWVLRYPRDEEVWIDAADGKVLGGIYREKRMGR